MVQKNIPILHVDGSLTEYLDKKRVLHKVAGLGGYIVDNGVIVDKFYKTMTDQPHLNHHEDYAIIEALKWAREKGYRVIKVKTDSLPSVHLFTHKKKNVTRADKFFLLQYLTVEFNFEYIDLIYHNRSDDDLAHVLSRSYLKELPKDIVRLHCENNKKKSDYEILADAGTKCDFEIKKVLQNNMKELLR